MVQQQQRQPMQLDPIPDPTVDLDPAASLNEIKCALLDVVYGTARGVNASLDQRAQVGEGGGGGGRGGGVISTF